MKTAIILADGVKQIMFTPETDNERDALKLIKPDDDINVMIKTGSFGEEHYVSGFEVSMCKAGFLRAWPSEDSVMFVLTPKNDETKNK